ncbi:hypothetical protein [Streptomyces sp. NPDC089799]|uniref:hypothetical protein n=1 Tax=Streptomyces sp. NPDC089799 TaxID=3155066 RepID=UPI003414AA0A
MDFPEDLIRLRQAQISLYNRMTAEPALRTTLAAELVRAGLAVSGHPYWRDHPATLQARLALEDAAAAAPGGETARAVRPALESGPSSAKSSLPHPPQSR